MIACAIRIESAAVNKADADGLLDESRLIKERRSKKVGMLPTKARMVLEASRRCLPADLGAPDALHTAIGVSLGTLHGSMDAAEQSLEASHTRGFGHVTPSWYATGLPNATAAVIASMHNFGGPNLTLLGHHAGVEAIIFACRQIAAGRAPAMLAGGFDLASERCVARLRAAPVFREAAAIHPGVGLMWLRANGTPMPGSTAVVGWSQGIMDDVAFRAGAFSGLIETAAGGALPGTPTIHIIHPGRGACVDYLAASGPIHAIEHIVAARTPGVHALVAKGFGPAVACLLLQTSD